VRRKREPPPGRLRAEFGTPEFDAEDRAAFTGKAPPAKADDSAGSLAWLMPVIASRRPG
jgi:hypothetical protein